ncbi:MAG: hypothetical protein NC182_01540 [Prevotella sp.]|nr:hypothetical protein [Staphylococcus sp.]MCM1349865.1 hypothetical protein [Prevotella sp.]
MKKVILKKEILTRNNIIDFTFYETKEKEEYCYSSWDEAVNKYNELLQNCKKEAKSDLPNKWLCEKSHYYDVLIVDEDGIAYGQKIMSDGTIIK